VQDDSSNVLCLALTAGRPKAREGEPVVLAISVRNCSKDPRQVDDLLDPAYGFLRLTLSGPGGGKPVPYRSAVRRDARGKQPRLLAPRERLSTWVPMYASADGWMLREAGRYQLHAQYEMEGVAPHATALELTVVAADNSRERAAAQLMMQTAPALLLGRRSPPDGGLSPLRVLLRDYRDSPLAPYARLALATVDLQESFDPALKTFRTPNCRSAIELLRPAVPRIDDPFLAATATRSLADCLKSLGRTAEADAALSAYAKWHRGGLELPGVRETLLGEDRHRLLSTLLGQLVRPLAP